ncbi:hypothetical protein [Fluoribacter gormanii]|uniref:hypothetical protein n=1 Tax=Fluoribacter gormanii TaxID=464 RepID=UPI0010418873|nr:hypothetical protein [Fluoribacter gormanii]
MNTFSKLMMASIVASSSLYSTNGFCLYPANPSGIAISNIGDIVDLQGCNTDSQHNITGGCYIKPRSTCASQAFAYNLVQHNGTLNYGCSLIWVNGLTVRLNCPYGVIQPWYDDNCL